jgi:hypothetical protein
MVTAYNDDDEYSGTGCETAPNPGISKQKSVRRISLTDTDDNSQDFVSIDYRATGNTATTNAEVDAWKPKNTAHGQWNPMAEVEEPPPPEGTAKLMILQAYGHANKSSPAITHSFVELYNNTNAAINLDSGNYSLQIAVAANNTAWTVINLSGTIPVRGSYLIRGAVVEGDISGARLNLSSVSPDVDGTFILDNDAFKVALMSNRTALTVANPFDVGGGAKAAGYVDMVSAYNDDDEYSGTGCETAPNPGISKQKSVRRNSLTDTDDNSADFVSVDYRAAGTTDAQKNAWMPRVSADGAWDPMAEVEEPPPPAGTAKLMILQAYGHNNKSDPAVTHSFVELYNNTNAAINVAGYSLQFVSGEGDDANGAAWTVINLTGQVPAHGSYLIRGAAIGDISKSRLDLSSVTADVNGTFILGNDQFKVALMSNQSALTVVNPFDTGGGVKSAGYVDMLGTGKAADVNGYETAPIDGISKQKAVRRKHLSDTDNNGDDFKIYDYRVPSNGISDADLERCRPRTAADGGWTPEFP